MALDAERLVAARVALELIRADAAADAHKLEGAPFDGRTVATNFGQVYASIYALAAILDDFMAAVLGEEPSANRLMDEAIPGEHQSGGGR